MERVTGKRLPQIISENLWAPMGAEEDANITLDTNGYGLACGGISASLRDLNLVLLCCRKARLTESRLYQLVGLKMLDMDNMAYL